jgi:hypothetical protein
MPAFLCNALELNSSNGVGKKKHVVLYTVYLADTTDEFTLDKELLNMKMSRIGVSLFGAALLLSTSAFAKDNDTNKGSLKLDDQVSVDGTPLKPGDYKVEWNGSGPNVTVTLLQGKHTVATFPAHVTEQTAPPESNAYGSEDQPNGGKALTAIYFGGKHYALQVEPNSANQQGETNQNNPAPAK